MIINNKYIYTKFNKLKNPKATIIITHGLCEHTHRYDHFVKILNDNNYQTFQYDIQGHGQSEGKRGNVKSYKSFIDDLDEIVKYVKNDNKDLPIIIFGHSLGGLISNLYVSTYNDKVNGLISSAAALDTPNNSKILKYIGFKLIGGFKISAKIFSKHLSRDENVALEQLSDPYSISHFKVNLAGQMFVKGIRYLKKHRSNIKVPVLYMHGTDDQIVSDKFSDNMYNSVSSEDKTLKKYVNAKHELLNEINKEEVLNDILTWLNQRF